MTRSSLLVAALALPACLDPNGTDLGETGGSSSTSTGGTTDAGTGSTGGVVDPPPAEAWPTLECDPLVPSYCGFPFPSNVFTQADATSPTGRRLALGRALIPAGSKDASGGPEIWNVADGFSAGVAAMAHLPGATIAGLAGPLDLERSRTDESPTVLLDAATGERVPHFAELDMSSGDDARRTFMIRPVVRLRDGARYIAAIRGVVDADGAPLPPSPAFAALRDGADFPDDPSIEARRPLYADIFARLKAAGVAREDLQLAWDWHTASREHNTAGLLKMRDEALAMLGDAGPPYVLDVAMENVDEYVDLYLEGRMTVPLYLDDPGPGGRLVLGPDGLPELQGTADYAFTVIVPHGAHAAPAPALQYGHGLLGSGRGEMQAEFRRAFAQEYNYVLFAVDWIGMAEDDYVHIAGLINDGRLTDFKTVVDRGQQGILNALLAMRMVTGGLAKDPLLQGKQGPRIDADQRYYHGNSQGGIFGATYMALTTDVRRGMLGVPGQPYNLLLNRSKDFDPFFGLLRVAFPDPIDDQMVLALFQMLWDRSEPSGFSAYIREPTLPGTPAHEVLMPVAIRDHQVSTLGAHIMARAIGGVVNLAPTNRAIFGLDEREGPHAGSAMIEYSFGLAPEPTTNVPASDGEDPHGKPRRLPAAERSLDRFLRTGVVESFCDGPCDPQ
jgi:hypothetical protein